MTIRWAWFVTIYTRFDANGRVGVGWTGRGTYKIIKGLLQRSFVSCLVMLRAKGVCAECALIRPLGCRCSSRAFEQVGGSLCSAPWCVAHVEATERPVRVIRTETVAGLF
jgi:hypothetical protein